MTATCLLHGQKTIHPQRSGENPGDIYLSAGNSVGEQLPFTGVLSGTVGTKIPYQVKAEGAWEKDGKSAMITCEIDGIRRVDQFSLLLHVFGGR